MLVTVLALFLHLAATLARLFRWGPLRLALAGWLCRQPARGHRRLPHLRSLHIRQRAKPTWVRKEVIRLKALMPRAGCRTVADCFNRRFIVKSKMTVGKTFVSSVIRRHRHEIAMLRRQINNTQPKRVPRNLVWGLDLTGKPTTDGATHMVLGILEHASRAALALEALENKSSWTLVRTLLAALERYGKPCAIRTDNESVSTSRAFRFALFLIGIHHQRTDPHCPWQNGRGERFFGTLKKQLDQLAVDSVDALNPALTKFRVFYNHVRPHQNLDGATPVEAWAGVDPYAGRIKDEYWFEAWDGLLRGYYLRR